MLLVGDGRAPLRRRAAASSSATVAWQVTDGQREVLASGDLGWAAGTVGAVARDVDGRLAAATSTGGTMGQRRGRVGDSPLIGAGTWADDDSVAVSCTGDGEAIIRVGDGARGRRAGAARAACRSSRPAPRRSRCSSAAAATAA